LKDPGDKDQEDGGFNIAKGQQNTHSADKDG
jgi:hypothetical protein